MASCYRPSDEVDWGWGHGVRSVVDGLIEIGKGAIGGRVVEPVC